MNIINTCTWTGSSTISANWSDPLNWTNCNNSYPNGNLDTATFPLETLNTNSVRQNSALQYPILDINITLYALVFTASTNLGSVIHTTGKTLTLGYEITTIGQGNIYMQIDCDIFIPDTLNINIPLANQMNFTGNLSGGSLNVNSGMVHFSNNTFSLKNLTSGPTSLILLSPSQQQSVATATLNGTLATPSLNCNTYNQCENQCISTMTVCMNQSSNKSDRAQCNLNFLACTSFCSCTSIGQDYTLITASESLIWNGTYDKIFNYSNLCSISKKGNNLMLNCN